MNDLDEIPTQALAVRDPDPAPPATVGPNATGTVPVTPAQAKVEAVAALTMACYARASELQLTPEEITALQAEFPDDAFKPGAAGKENLIYIEHAFLRDRLNTVLGLGQWALIPRSGWTENFRTGSGKEAVRVYVEAMLVIRGAFVGEAVGDMSYYPNNDSQNYGDAVEGAKTAALRRCCKEFGIGLQAWKKDFCEGWWARRRKPSASSFRTAPSPAPAPSPASKPAPDLATRAEQKSRLLERLGNDPEARIFFEQVGALLPTETLPPWREVETGVLPVWRTWPPATDEERTSTSNCSNTM